jgi:tetratricopeptide (TPR) repeat protein
MRLLARIIVLVVLIGCGVMLYVKASRKDSVPSAAAPARPLAHAAMTTSPAPSQPASPVATSPGKGFATVAQRSAARLAARWQGLCREIADLASARSATGLSAASAGRLAMLRQGDRLLAAGQFAQATVVFAKACDAYPDDPDTLEGLAIAMVAAEQFSDSLAVYQRLLKLHDDDPTTLFNYALALSRLHKLPQAEEVYRTLLSRHERFLQARYNLASVYQADGKLTQAGEQWKEVIALQPEMAYPHAKLGELLLDLGEPTGAMDELGLAAKLDPDNPVAWLNYSAAAQAAGSYGVAIVAVNKAAKIGPASAAQLARLGGLLIELYERTGQDNLRMQALDAWRQCIKLDPDHDQAAKMLRQYEKPAASRP